MFTRETDIETHVCPCASASNSLFAFSCLNPCSSLSFSLSRCTGETFFFGTCLAQLLVLLSLSFLSRETFFLEPALLNFCFYCLCLDSRVSRWSLACVSVISLVYVFTHRSTPTLRRVFPCVLLFPPHLFHDCCQQRTPLCTLTSRPVFAFFLSTDRIL